MSRIVRLDRRKRRNAPQQACGHAWREQRFAPRCALQRRHQIRQGCLTGYVPNHAASAQAQTSSSVSVTERATTFTSGANSRIARMASVLPAIAIIDEDDIRTGGPNLLKRAVGAQRWLRPQVSLPLYGLRESLAVQSKCRRR